MGDESLQYRTINVRAHWRRAPKKKTRNKKSKAGKHGHKNDLNKM